MAGPTGARAFATVGDMGTRSSQANAVSIADGAPAAGTDLAAGLVNGSHFELDSHDVLMAEGSSSESFLDDGSRGMFHNAHEYRALYPAAPPGAGSAPRAAKAATGWKRCGAG